MSKIVAAGRSSQTPACSQRLNVRLTIKPLKPAGRRGGGRERLLAGAQRRPRPAGARAGRGGGAPLLRQGELNVVGSGRPGRQTGSPLSVAAGGGHGEPHTHLRSGRRPEKVGAGGTASGAGRGRACLWMHPPRQGTLPGEVLHGTEGLHRVKGAAVSGHRRKDTHTWGRKAHGCSPRWSRLSDLCSERPGLQSQPCHYSAVT